MKLNNPKPGEANYGHGAYNLAKAKADLNTSLPCTEHLRISAVVCAEFAGVIDMG